MEKEKPAPKEPKETRKVIIQDEEVESEKLKTQYQKLSGPKMTGEKIDLSQFEKPKKKKPADDKQGVITTIIIKTGNASASV